MSTDDGHQRLKEMKQMQLDPSLTAKARERERRADEKSGGLVAGFKPVKLGTGGPSGSAGGKAGGGGFKKGGFKSAFGGTAVMPDQEVGAPAKVKVEGQTLAGQENVPVGTTEDRAGEECESDTDEEDYYDPFQPTGCPVDCLGRIK